MRIRGSVICFAASAIFVAGCSSTSNQPRRHQEAPWHPAVAIVEKYADKTGVVTRAAMEAGLKADFDLIDIHHTGCLDEDEVRAENQRRWQLDASTYSPLIDFKHTGCVDFQEYAETATASSRPTSCIRVRQIPRPRPALPPEATIGAGKTPTVNNCRKVRFCLTG
jgi:hypothetical protein